MFIEKICRNVSLVYRIFGISPCESPSRNAHSGSKRRIFLLGIEYCWYIFLLSYEVFVLFYGILLSHHFILNEGIDLYHAFDIIITTSIRIIQIIISVESILTKNT